MRLAVALSIAAAVATTLVGLAATMLLPVRPPDAAMAARVSAWSTMPPTPRPGER